MRQRRFKIIRKPELEGSSFLFNNVRVQYVATCPDTGISFYCNNGVGGVTGVRVYPDGRKEKENATGVKKGKPYAHGRNEYLQFKHAFGNHMGISASHAVWMAAGRTIPPGMTMDHIDGCTTNNDYRNLRCIDGKTNSRDGGFMRKLRNHGINVAMYPGIILEGYERLARFKETHSHYAYRHLTRTEQLQIFLGPAYRIDPGASSQRNGRSGFRLKGYDRMEWEMSHHMET